MDYATVMRHIDYGRGKAAQNIGQPFSVFRPLLTSGTNDYLSNTNKIATNVQMLPRVHKRSADIDAPEHMGAMFYRMIIDASQWVVGDVFVQTDPVYGIGDTIVDFGTLQFVGLALAYHAPQKETIGVRIDRVATVYRLNPQPDGTTYWESSIDNALPVVINNGVFSLGTVGTTPAQIPIGMQSHSRIFNRIFRSLPEDTGHTRWFGYVPPLNGFNFKEGDRIIIDKVATGQELFTGGRYVVQHPYSQAVGLVGSTLVMEREISSN